MKSYGAQTRSRAHARRVFHENRGRVRSTPPSPRRRSRTPRHEKAVQNSCSFVSIRGCSDFLRDEEWGTVGAGEEFVGRGAGEEFFALGIEFEFGADPEGGFGRVHADGFGVFERGHDAVAN